MGVGSRSVCATSSGRPSTRDAVRRRRGAVAVWTLMFVALLVTILCVVLEIAHLYLARTELENALEAAVLAAADHWAKNPGDTLASRTRGVQYAAANTVDNQPVVLGTNYGTDDVNQNAGPAGNLIFGAVSFAPVRVADNAYAFDHATEPSCTVTEVVEAEVDIPWKIQTKQQTGTYGDDAVFELEYYHFTPINPPSMPTPKITKITYGLAGTGGAGLGRFDVNTSTPTPTETNLGLPALSGWGPFNDLTAPWQVTFTPTTPDGAPNVRYKTLQVVPTTPFLPGANHVIRFGVDTDMMDGTPGPTVVNTKDQGGNNSFNTSDFYMAIEFEGDSAHPLILYGNGPGVHSTPTQTFLNRGQAQKFSFTITRPGNGTFGVRAQANVQVTPWLQSFLGVPIGPFRVAARTTARAGCEAPTRLVRIATDPYTQFPDPTP